MDDQESADIFEWNRVPRDLRRRERHRQQYRGSVSVTGSGPGSCGPDRPAGVDQ